MVRLPLICLFLLPAFCYADPIPKPDRNAIKIEGTTWEGVDSLGNQCKYTFLKDGEIEYTSNNSKPFRGTWKLEGKKVIWEFNNHYSDSEGIVKKDEIKIESHNVTGLKWTITLKPVKDDKKEKGPSR